MQKYDLKIFKMRNEQLHGSDHARFRVHPQGPTQVQDEVSHESSRITKLNMILKSVLTKLR